MQSIRILRVLKLFYAFNKSTIILDILILSVRHLLNTLLILLVIFFIYGIVGMNMFPYLKRRSGITANSNFSTLPLAMFTLIGVSTGENWAAILEDSVKTNRANDVCLPINSFSEFEKYEKQFIGCGGIWAYTYYISFILIFNYTLLNLFTGIIIETFNLRARLASSIVRSKDIQAFFALWEAIDEEGEGMMHWLDAKMLLYVLEPPLGLQIKARSDKLINELWISLRIPLYKFKTERKIYVHVYDMALSLCKLAIQLDSGFEE